MNSALIALALVGIGSGAGAQDGGRGEYRGDRSEQRYEQRGDRFDRDDRRGRRNMRTFETPRIGGLALDICPRDVGWDGLARGRCGMPVANEFCRSRGFTEAVDAPTTQGLGPTRFIRTGGVVEHQWATGFRYINCER